MKRSFIIVFAMFLSFSVMAQNANPKHEVSLGYGVGTMTDFSSLFNAIGNGIASGLIAPMGYTVDNQDNGMVGAINLDYGYHVSKKLLIGGTLSYARMGEKLGYKNTNTGVRDEIGTSKTNCIALMPSLKVNWNKNKYITFYSRISAGGLFMFESLKYNEQKEGQNNKSNTEVTFAFQITPIGLEFGNNLRGYTEIGFGQAGMLQAGLRYRF